MFKATVLQACKYNQKFVLCLTLLNENKNLRLNAYTDYSSFFYPLPS